MRYDPAKTAILFFSRSAVAESLAKPFAGRISQKRSQQLAQHLIRHSLQTARQTQLPLVPCFSQQQKGHSFGERLANAIEAVWDRGFQQVIVMGNDCPDLTSALLLQSAAQLQSHPITISPAHDGGVNLIGLRKSHYQRAAFVALPWETEQLQNSWVHYANQMDSPIFWLAGFRDIDHLADLHRYLHAGAHLMLRKKLKQILQRAIRPNGSYPPTFSLAEQRFIRRFRAPPA